MNNFLLTVAGILVVILCALFAVPPLIDWNDYRGAFEEEASRLLDREVRVRGAVNVRILPVPYVSFEKVRIADTRGIPGSFARAERFKMWLAVPPLLRGILEARQIELEKPSFRLRVDDEGRGNWQQLKINSANLAFMPADVALNSVEIEEGEVLFESSQGETIARLGNVSGEFTAPALAGPYKFIGSMQFAGKPHEVRFSTAVASPNGDVRSRTSIRSPDGRTSHTIDATIRDLLARTRVDGRIVSKKASSKRSEAGFEITASLALDPQELRLKDISASFDSPDRPQVLTGDAVATWKDAVATRMTLASRWLDLDAIASPPGKPSPIKVLEALLTSEVGELGSGETTVKLKIDEANLGGKTVTGLDASMVRRQGVTRIGQLRLDVPGRTAVAIDGFLERRKTGLHFDGHLVTRGASLAELTEWLGTAETGLDSAVLGSFRFSGPLRVRPTSFELDDASVSLGDARAVASIVYDWSKKPFVVADLSAGELNLAQISDDALSPARIVSLLGFGKAEQAGRFGKWLRGVDLTLKVRARQLADAERRFERVALDLKREGDKLHLGQVDATWAPGFEVRLSGNFNNVAGEPTGGLTGTIAAANPAAAGNLARVLSLAAGTSLPAQSLAAMTPMRAAVDARLSAGQSGASRLTVDGKAGADRFRIVASTKGPYARWRDQQAQIDAIVEAREAAQTLQWLLASRRDYRPPLQAGPGSIRMAATGMPKRGMKAFVSLDAGSMMDAAYSGDLKIEDDEDDGKDRDGGAKLVWSGKLDVRRAQWPALAAIASPKLAAYADAIDVSGRLSLAGSGRRLTISPVDFRIGRSTVSGKVEAAPLADGRTGVTGEIAFNSVSGRDLASLMLASSGPAEPRQAGNGFWTERVFNFAALAGFRADLKLSASALQLAPSLKLTDAGWQVVIDGGRVAVRDFAGRYAGTSVKAQAQFDQSQAGVLAKASVTSGALPLARLVPALAQSKRLRGTATLKLDFNGKALSPNSLATVVQGNGTIELSDAAFPGLDSARLTTLARAVVDGEAEVGALDGLVEAQTLSSSIGFDGKHQIGLKVGNGSLLVSEFSVPSEVGELRNRTTIDIASWSLDSEWTVRPAPQPDPAGGDRPIALPPVRVIYAGPISGLGDIEPRLSVGDLKRELVVRKMEADVAKLEQQRRDDEARAAAEAERRRLIEEEQRRSLEEEERRRNEALPEPAAVRPAEPLVDDQGNVPPAGASGASGTPGAPEAAGSQSGETSSTQSAQPEPRPPRRVRRKPPKPLFNPWNNSQN